MSESKKKSPKPKLSTENSPKRVHGYYPPTKLHKLADAYRPAKVGE